MIKIHQNGIVGSVLLKKTKNFAGQVRFYKLYNMYMRYKKYTNIYNGNRQPKQKIN